MRPSVNANLVSVLVRAHSLKGPNHDIGTDKVPIESVAASTGLQTTHIEAF